MKPGRAEKSRSESSAGDTRSIVLPHCASFSFFWPLPGLTSHFAEARLSEQVTGLAVKAHTSVQVLGSSQPVSPTELLPVCNGLVWSQGAPSLPALSLPPLDGDQWATSLQEGPHKLG